MSNWIKCSEQLPKIRGIFSQSEWVLCYGIEDFDNDIPRIFIGFLCDKQFYSKEGKNIKVTHWQPLPEPPKD